MGKSIRVDEKDTFGLRLIEKIFGLILVGVGIILANLTFNNLNSAGMGGGYFLGTSIFLIITGVIIIIVKTK